MVSLEFLEKIEVFKTLNDNQLKAIQDCVELADFKKDERIFTQGDDATHVWIILEGDVELKSETPGKSTTSPVSFLSETHVFGWTCFVPPHKYLLSGYCASRWCKVVKLKKDDLLRLFEEDDVFGFKVMDYLMAAVGKQFEQYQDQVARERGIEVMSQW